MFTTKPPTTPSNSGSSSSTIHKDMLIADLVRDHPSVVEMLTYEWGFHCVNCIISNFETLEQGASTHGIEGEDFEIMMQMIQDVVSSAK